MRKHDRTRTAVSLAALSALALSALTGCQASTPEETGPVALVIGNRPAATEEARRDLFDARVKEFQKAHPDYKITTTEDGWDAQTFAARLAAGDLPTVTGVPFTEIRGLIERGQVADITDAVTETGVIDLLNPQIVEIVTKDDHYYGVPTSAYAMGLVYNRAVFEAAGLDPDSPPTTWDEVRAAAKTITEKTGQPGFAQVTTENQGGWVLGTEIIARGGAIVNEAGDAPTFASQQGIDALQYLHDMRWKDGSLSPNGLLSATELAQAFAAGQAGMFILQSDAYQPLTELLGFPAKDFGFAAMPTLTAGEAPVTLSGGNIDIVSPKATPAEAKAAVEWIAFAQLGRYENKEAARAYAEALASQGSAVAIPGLPVVTAERYQEYLEWVSDINTVPLANFAPYLDRVSEQSVVSEPPSRGQDIYAALDPVVQAVITDEKADIVGLLNTASDSVETLLSR
ncbi:extracellular solute-binding protein [Microbacterium sp.]|uniref:extracellular solute-binding protein n=1 Tax=Microbacterium sp. TaxID=51671 RepID=UPI0039E30C42